MAEELWSSLLICCEGREILIGSELLIDWSKALRLGCRGKRCPERSTISQDDALPIA